MKLYNMAISSLIVLLMGMVSSVSADDATCYIISDDIAEIYVVKPDVMNVGIATVISTEGIGENTHGIYNGEGTAYNSKTDELYVFNNPLLNSKNDDHKFDFYTVNVSDPKNPVETLVKENFVNFEPVGAEVYKNKLYIVEEKKVSTLYVYDIKTWKLSKKIKMKGKISGLAIDSHTGKAYVMDDRDKNGTIAAELFKLNLITGRLTSVGKITNLDFDAESLSFANDGRLYTENERGVKLRSIYEIDTKDASINLAATLPGINSLAKNDIESMTCNTGKSQGPTPGGEKKVPTTDDKMNPKILNTSGPVDLLNLSGKDTKGKAIKNFIIVSLPNAKSGTLYMADGNTSVKLDQNLTKDQADGLKFDPKDGYVGDASFRYVSVDSKGLKGDTGTVTIPVVGANVKGSTTGHTPGCKCDDYESSVAFDLNTFFLMLFAMTFIGLSFSRTEKLN